MPIVSTMSEEIIKTSQWVENYKNQFAARYGGNRFDFDTIKNRLNNLSSLCRADQNFSIDTYAKKLMHKKLFSAYENLKRDITLYFLLQQKKKGVDLRYDNFWASILNEDHLPDNIKILSWNYDYQLELSFQDFINNDSLSQASTILQVKNPTQNLPQNANNQFCIFKLNGSATVKKRDSEEINYIIDKMRGMEEMEFFLQLGTSNLVESQYYENMMSFAWDNKHSDGFATQLKKVIKSTDVLVVIGYSFPFFNRVIDKMILSAAQMPQLSKIYIQDPNADAITATISGLLDPYRDIEIKPIINKDQFFLPFEL